MLHERTQQSIARSRRRRIVAAIVVVALAIACWFAYGAVSQNLREQGAASIRTAILDASMQCCAIEGSYPASLKHLEDEYGLAINHDDYIITYEVYAANIAPSVTVAPR
ncbi:hypothetical protein [Raoultibacter phocaeensis]|uniref:hypothetical protein n=1 Tax=Raoultibacter phocaeensis TaxID=2479841 RepID=UPI001118ACB3|nr:hypothetical protein [Raoultibacter phocaeensis]